MWLNFRLLGQQLQHSGKRELMGTRPSRCWAFSSSLHSQYIAALIRFLAEMQHYWFSTVGQCPLRLSLSGFIRCSSFNFVPRSTELENMTEISVVMRYEPPAAG